MIQPPSRIAAYWAIGGFMVIALLLRVTMLGITPYNIDEAAASIFASQIAHFKAFPLIGIETSQGFHNPPFFLYLLAPLFFFTPDPRFAMVILAMLGTAAVGLTGLTARRLWGGWAAIFAALIVCFSVTAIEHSRRLWGHDTIIFWSAISCYCMVRSIQAQRRRWSWTALAAAAAAQACHLSGVTLWILPAGMLILARPRNWRLSLVIGMIILAIVYLPWILHDVGIGNEESRPALSELKIMLGLSAGQRAEDRTLSPAPAPLSWSALLNDSASNEILSEEYRPFFKEEFVLGWLQPIIHGIMALLMIAGIAALIVEAIRLRLKDPDAARWSALIAASALAPAIIFTLLPATTVPSYQLPAFVPGALAAAFFLRRGMGIAECIEWKEIRPRGMSPSHLAAALSILAAFALYSTSYTIGARIFVARATEAKLVSPVLKFKLDAVTFVTASAAGVPYAITQDGRSHASGVDYWVLYLHWYVSGDPRAPNLRSAPHVYVILDNRTVLREPLEAFLANRDFTRFGTLRVYRIFGRDTEFWRFLTEAYPSAPPDRGSPAGFPMGS